MHPEGPPSGRTFWLGCRTPSEHKCAPLSPPPSPLQAGPHVLAQLLHYLSSAPGTFSPQLGCLVGTACAGCVDGMGPSDLVQLAQALANIAPAPPHTPPGAAAASAEAGRGEGTAGRGEGQTPGGSGPPYRNGLTPWQQRLLLEVCR